MDKIKVNTLKNQNLKEMNSYTSVLIAVVLYSAELVFSYVHAMQKRETVAVNKNISSYGKLIHALRGKYFNLLEFHFEI